MTLYGIIGAGGFGREVIPLASHWLPIWHGADHDSELVFVVEDQFYTRGTVINGYRVLSLTDFLAAKAVNRRYNIAIGNSTARERIAESIPREAAEPFAIVAQNHVALDGNTTGEGAIFCSFSHITSNISIGKFFHANIYSYIGHNCTIGDYVTFAPGVKCNGHVVIEDHAYIGTGAIIRDGSEEPIVIGRGAIVGMGAVVTKSVAPGTTVVGIPAKPIR
jgi:sugar O-acyltransferase (sialic acid O-acetyltransferase NeuD family)